MIQGGQDLRFSLKSAHSLGIRGKLLGKDFQGDVPVQLGIGGPVHLSHPALAYLLKNLVMADGRTEHGTPPSSCKQICPRCYAVRLLKTMNKSSPSSRSRGASLLWGAQRRSMAMSLLPLASLLDPHRCTLVCTVSCHRVACDNSCATVDLHVKVPDL